MKQHYGVVAEIRALDDAEHGNGEEEGVEAC